jgi:alkylation response protein AidB-like acyl-CoA dehydrogenase
MFYSKRDIKFQLYEVINAESLTQYPYFQDHDRDSFDMILEAADQIAEKMLFPLLTEMDRKEPQLVDGKIRVHEGMKAITKRFGEDGWISAPFSYEHGGQQIPATVLNMAAFSMQSANYSASVFPFLTTGAANLILTFGSKALQDTYTPKMFSGAWQGTMALTEPDAGSSLSDITTSATPSVKEGVYKIKGQKIFISCGDHDACDNVIHLMLARIAGAPTGVKGISLFVVPQHRLIENDPNRLESNDVLSAGVYHKMGYKGAPIAHLMMGENDNCYGYLVGEANKGLNYMFQMMNEARVGVGANAVAIGTAAYHASLKYAKERPQGRKINDKDPSKPQTLIINHADVKRLLLFQKAVVEGSLSLICQCNYLTDLAHVEQGEVKENALLLLDFLTPIAKSYPSEMCCLTTSAAVQIHGGAGYTTEFPVEQYYREARIHPIHEGTTGIHGMDLLGRKTTMRNGKAAQLFAAEITKAIEEAANYPELGPLSIELQHAAYKAQKVTAHLLNVATTNVEAYLSDATLYLEMVGIITIAWQWLRQAQVAQKALNDNPTLDADFYKGKLMTAKYFYEYELVRIDALAKRLTSSDCVTIDMQSAWF